MSEVGYHNDNPVISEEPMDERADRRRRLLIVDCQRLNIHLLKGHRGQALVMGDVAKDMSAAPVGHVTEEQPPELCHFILRYSHHRCAKLLPRLRGKRLFHRLTEVTFKAMPLLSVQRNQRL